MEDKVKVIIVREGLWQSVISDLITFSALLGTLFINHNYCGSSWMVEAMVVFMTFCWSMSKANKKVRNVYVADADKAFDAIKEMEVVEDEHETVS